MLRGQEMHGTRQIVPIEHWCAPTSCMHWPQQQSAEGLPDSLCQVPQILQLRSTGVPGKVDN